ncbi:MAG: hypothetical protein K2O18_08665, partial [Oscillospiraceae bacterium]|nr:hypothetical protein [Oscillospiraceae bacterium]
MDALTIRRYKGFRMPNSLEMNRTEKPAAASAAQSVSKTADAKAPENLRQLMDQVSRLESQLRQNYRTLQTGEAVLDEVQDSLERMAKLAKQALDGGDPAALQEELEQLRDEIGRMLDSASVNGEKLFLNDGTEDAAALQAAEDAAADSAQEQALPDWLVRGVLLGSLTSGQILSALGLDKTAAGADILDAVSNSSLEDNPALAYTAALYLGAVISGDPENCSQTDALHGLQQLFEQVAKGVPVDEAIAELTNGAFTSMEDFETQFLDGTAPGLGNFLTSLLLDDANSLLLDGLDFSAVDFSALALLGNLNGIDLSMLVMPSLFDMLQSAGNPAQQEDIAPETQNAAPEPQSAVSDAAADAANASGTAGGAAAASGKNASTETAAVQYGTVLVTGRDLSGVSFDTARNVLTVSGTADVTVRGTDRDGPAIVLNGSGTVTLREVNIPALTVGHTAARAAGAGRIAELRFLPGASLTLSGGRLEFGSLHRTGGGNTLYLTGGAVVTQKQADGTLQTLNIPVVLDGAVSFAAHAASVTAPEGKALDPLDIVWKTFLPGWDSISAMTVDGKQAKMELNEQDPLRLWLNRGDSGAPVHTVTLKGRGKSGEARTRYAYLRWNRRANAFQEVAMYPNPFRVTGGEEHRDWMYVQTSRTLRILTEKVTAVSGGTGTDANEEPFSGRIALTDNIGAPSLSLGGVVCRVDNGRAFSLGRGNDVTLVLKSGVDNHFESGAGYAG